VPAGDDLIDFAYTGDPQDMIDAADNLAATGDDTSLLQAWKRHDFSKCRNGSAGASINDSVDGGPGDDTLLWYDGADTLSGGKMMSRVVVMVMIPSR
jgi:hypothetical protein